MKTNLQVLNEISAKLGGESDAVVVTEALNNIANALGDNEPDKIKTISESLEDILEYVGGGGSGGWTETVRYENNDSVTLLQNPDSDEGMGYYAELGESNASYFIDNFSYASMTFNGDSISFKRVPVEDGDGGMNGFDFFFDDVDGSVAFGFDDNTLVIYVYYNDSPQPAPTISNIYVSTIHKGE